MADDDCLSALNSVHTESWSLKCYKSQICLDSKVYEGVNIVR